MRSIWQGEAVGRPTEQCQTTAEQNSTDEKALTISLPILSRMVVFIPRVESSN